MGDKTVYHESAEKYRPEKIKILLVGEAPPPEGKKPLRYFYIVPEKIVNNRSRKGDAGLPSTIFYHYFDRAAKSEEEYRRKLLELQTAGIFLVDIYDDPIRVRKNKENKQKVLRSINTLRDRLSKRRIDIEKIGEENVIFLMARGGYVREIKKYFPDAKMVRWIKFRMSSELLSN